MAKVEASVLREEILDVLRSSSKGKGSATSFLTAYQIFDRLSGELQELLCHEYGNSGQGAGEHFSPASRVAQVADQLEEVEKEYLDTRGLQFDIGSEASIGAGYSLCAIFRIIP